MKLASVKMLSPGCQPTQQKAIVSSATHRATFFGEIHHFQTCQNGPSPQPSTVQAVVLARNGFRGVVLGRLQHVVSLDSATTIWLASGKPKRSLCREAMCQSKACGSDTSALRYVVAMLRQLQCVCICLCQCKCRLYDVRTLGSKRAVFRILPAVLVRQAKLIDAEIEMGFGCESHDAQDYNRDDCQSE